jgi:alpha-D-ribose 1-methylphosphonate 5-triphosphate synthase subunit PhnH
MSTLSIAQPYDVVFDAQKHYRALLQCTARPGAIGQLDDVLLEVPQQLTRATMLIALTLFSSDTTFSLTHDEGRVADFLSRETSAKVATPDQADFLILADAGQVGAIRQARQGALAYPDQGATLIVQVEAISPAPVTGGLRLTLTGPGIETEAVVFVFGVTEELFEILRERNAEFPMGVDTYLTCNSLSMGPCVLALPRTTRVLWERV